MVENKQTISYQSKPVAMIEHVSWLMMRDSMLLTSENIDTINFNNLLKGAVRNKNNDIVKILSKAIDQNLTTDHGIFVENINHVKFGQYAIFNFSCENIYIKDRTELTIPAKPVGIKNTSLTNALFSDGSKNNIDLSDYVLVVRSVSFPNTEDQLDQVFANIKRLEEDGKLANNYDLRVMFDNLKKEIQQDSVGRHLLHSTNNNGPINFSVCYLIKVTNVINKKIVNGNIENAKICEISNLLNANKDHNTYKYGVYYPQLDLVISGAPNIQMVIDHPMSQVNLDIFGFSTHEPTYEYENGRITSSGLHGVNHGVIVSEPIRSNQVNYTVYTKNANVKYYRYDKNLDSVFDINSIASTTGEEYLEIHRNQTMDEKSSGGDVLANKIKQRVELNEALEKKYIHTTYESAMATKHYKESEVAVAVMNSDLAKYQLKNDMLSSENTKLEMSKQIALIENQSKIDSTLAEKIIADIKQERILTEHKMELIKSRLEAENLERKEKQNQMDHMHSLREKRSDETITTLKLGVGVLTVVGAGIVTYGKFK